MSTGYNFIEQVVEAAGKEPRHGLVAFSSAVFVSVIILLLAVAARYSLNRKADRLVPDGSLTVRNFFDIISSFIVWLGDNAMGRENRNYLPFVATLFFYIFTMNLLGLFPGFVMPTDVFQFNLGVGLCVFTMYNYWGIRDGGLGHYLKHLWGPVWWLGFLLFPIELVSQTVRPLTLSLRLFGNMTGDHLALSIFSNLTKGTYAFWIPIVFYILGTIVSFIQAFVFTLLTMIYIRLAVAHEE